MSKTPEGCEKWNHLKTASEMMDSVTEYMNEQIRDIEKKKKILKIQEKIDKGVEYLKEKRTPKKEITEATVDLILPSRKFVYEGVLFIVTDEYKKDYDARKVVLFNDSILYGKEIENGGIIFEQLFILDTVPTPVLVEVVDKKYQTMFQIKKLNEELTFIGEDIETRNKWVKQISPVIKTILLNNEEKEKNFRQPTQNSSKKSSNNHMWRTDPSKRIRSLTIMEVKKESRRRKQSRLSRVMDYFKK